MNIIVNLLLIAVVKVQFIPTRIRNALHIRKLKKQLDKLAKGTSHVQ